MKGIMKRISALVLAAAMMIPTVAYAEPTASDELVFPELGKKTAEALVKPGDYDITLSVPGALQTEQYSEIIVMVDASSSQGSNLQKLKETLVDIADQVLHNDGSVRLTLMGFGLGPATVGSFYNAETLEAYLADVTQADLRQGVSATNCEAAFDHIREYIENSEDLNKTCVIFTSDGESNHDEVGIQMLEWDKHQEWHYKKVSNATIYGAAIEVLYGQLLNGGNMIKAAVDVAPEEAIAVEKAKAANGVGSAEHKAAVTALCDAITASEETGVAFVDSLIVSALATIGLDAHAEAGNTVSKMEKAFLTYEGGAYLNPYLYMIHGMENAGVFGDSDSYYKNTTWGYRASLAADKLCENDKVLELFMVDFKGNANIWMNPESVRPEGRVVTSDKITYMKNTSYGAAVDSIKALSSEMFKTTYNNTTIVDPMSKWVKLDENSIRIYRDDTLIWTVDEGWLIDESEIPTANPVKIDTDANGHKRITWLIKDGPLYYTDRYYLKYTVDVDETVEGFEYDTMYPANDPTHVEYIDENGEKQEDPIEVPDVQQPTEPDDFKEDDMGFRIYKSDAEDKTPISDITFKIYNVAAEDGDTISEKPTAEEVAKYATDANLVGSITTNAAGYAALNVTEAGYGEGLYLIIEQESEKVKAPVDPFYVALPMYDEEAKENVNVVSIYPKNEPIDPDEPPIPPVIPPGGDKDETGKITILKHKAGNEDKVLKGAEFQVYRLAAAGEEAVETATYEGEEIGLVPVANEDGQIVLKTDKDGIATSPELKYGLYFLLETKAPLGYIALDEAIAVWVNTESASVSYAVKIPNTSITILPETGGIGTTIFTISGTVIILLGVVLIFRRRRNDMK